MYIYIYVYYVCTCITYIIYRVSERGWRSFHYSGCGKIALREVIETTGNLTPWKVHTQPGKLTTCYWKWTCCSLIYLRNMVIFHSYVSLPKGKWWNRWMSQWCVMICIDGNWSCREVSSFDLAAADQTQLNFRDCYPKPLWGWTAKSKRSK